MLKRSRKLDRVVKVIVTLAVFVLLWELICDAFKVPTFLVPAPSAIASRLYHTPGLFVGHTIVTLYETASGFLIAVLFGILTAAIIVSVPAFYDILMPLLLLAQLMPKVAVAPLLLIWFGYGLLPKMLLAFLVAFFPIVVNTISGLSSVDRELVELGLSLEADLWQTLWKFRMPSALPALFDGMKVAITLAVIGAVIGEFVGGNKGLGYLVIVANQELDAPLAFAAILILSLGGMMLYWLVELVERLVIPWNFTSESWRGPIGTP